MSKYDFEIDLSPNSSTGIILSKIKKESVVLEFGCATGRMTRYMKEALGCRVYIVEYDKEAYETALQYAEDGVCDDIMNFQWAEKFSGIEFDAIIFADVLEHLSDPEKVLERAASLLKDAGSLHVSIPNITHNDILLKAYEERFDYTATGILDDTHVCFWGEKNIKTLADRSGLNIRSVTGTFCPTGCTEQYEPNRNSGNILLENILKERQCGEVYQFVVTFDKSTLSDVEYRFRTPAIQSHIYLDTGNDFNAEEVISFESEYSGNGSYTACYEIKDTEKINRLRFDPIEFQGCILRNVSIRQGRENLQFAYPDGIEMAEGILLPGTDPMIYAEVLSKDDAIVISAEIVILGKKYIHIVEDAYRDKCTAFSGLQEEITSLTAEKKDLQGSIGSLSEKNRLLQGNIDDLTSKNSLFQGSVVKLTSENEDLRRDLGAYIILANNKEKYILELERELKYYKSFKVVKLHMLFIRILRGIKRRIKRVMGKEVH